jgi:pimeloyl-ACP methyl ester carboxylesterase
VSVAEHDILVPPRFSRTLAAQIPGAELQVIPAAAGHGYFLERPETFNQLSLDFLARAIQQEAGKAGTRIRGDDWILN